MDWNKVQKEGTAFTHDGKQFVDFTAGPRNRRAVVCGPGVLHPRYGFCWFYNPDSKETPTREDAAKILIHQHQFALMDHRAHLLTLGRLGPKGDETGKIEPDKILLNAANVVCSDREYAVAAA